MTTDLETREKPKRKQQIREGNRFGTSEAAKRRKQAKLDPKAGKGGTTAAVATILTGLEPGIPPAMRTEMARNIASVATITEGLSVGVIAKVRQSLAKSEGIDILVLTVPGAARYVRSLILGKDENDQPVLAPHADRLKAAQMVFEYAQIVGQADKDERDLSELTVEELQQRATQVEHAIDVKLTLPEVGNAAPLDPETPPMPESGTPPSRQAVE